MLREKKNEVIRDGETDKIHKTKNETSCFANIVVYRYDR